jgi:hypothetical protein
MSFDEADRNLMQHLFDDPDYPMSVNERWAFTRKTANYLAWLEAEHLAMKNLCSEQETMIARLVSSNIDTLTIRDR